jgi:hypothetical protein
MRQYTAFSFAVNACFATAPLLLALTGLRLNAQSAQRTRGAIDGLVTDTSLVPLDGAIAGILGSPLEVRTGENGRFRMLGLLPGQYLVAVRRVGYAPISTFLTVAANDTAHASFLLRQIVTELDAMKVKATSVASALSEFEARRATGVGQFMTEANIQRLNFVETTGLLRTFLSTSVRTADVMNTRGFGLRECPMRIFIDGVAIAVRDLESDLPRPSDLAGIEVHANSATVPLQYATAGGARAAERASARGSRANVPGGASCGVVLLWTKH